MFEHFVFLPPSMLNVQAYRLCLVSHSQLSQWSSLAVTCKFIQCLFLSSYSVLNVIILSVLYIHTVLYEWVEWKTSCMEQLKRYIIY